MSYKILYEGKTPVTKLYQRKNSSGVVACMILLGLAAAKFFYPEFDKIVHQLIFPGSGADTLVFLELAIADIRQGIPVGDALYAFCSEVIANAVY